MNNIQFATALHILTMLAITKDNLSSSYIAGSININPAMVRKSLSILSVYGLIDTKEGKGGGASLAKPADKILLSDIYGAVNDANVLGKLNSPNPECNTGKQINRHLLELFDQADHALITKLGTITLADFCQKFK
ncbi:RrF2 family transcriptional regulator [Pedobacter sp. MR2016-24]|uniref:RrF2 family transcriptional regulator n=1 Tax=Pedobacter sp. MR2016-24 TaxID=2994466 RepID=UPI002246CC20|nr:Rrf2 family transcriptional regulator [Pedobacter sp. MR2016-24]MCX2484614.1 Rrf2 family transcriptional regulator [Pedobacter sp. MR2016-24]